MQAHGKCIFCDGFGLSKEHVWPRWLTKTVPAGAKSGHLTTISRKVSHNMSYEMGPLKSGKQQRPGAITSRRLCVVCKNCNNEWMSQLQEEVKDLLLIVMENRYWSTMTGIEVTKLAKWITMFVIVSEYLHPERVTTNASERETFYKTKKPLSNWAIWIAYHIGEIKNGVKVKHGTIRHTSLARHYNSEAYQARHNHTGITTTICGDMLFQTFSTNLDNTILDVRAWANANGLALIHPLSAINAEGIKTYNDENWEKLHNNLVSKAIATRPPRNLSPSI